MPPVLPEGWGSLLRGDSLDDVRVTSVRDGDGGHTEVLTAGRAEVDVV